MCGGDGAYKLVEQLLSGGSKVQIESTVQYSDNYSSSDLVREIQCMYARGDIDASTLQRLISMVAPRHTEAPAAGPTTTPSRLTEEAVHLPPSTCDPALQSILQQLKAERSQLQLAYDETYQALQRLEAEAHTARKQAEEAANQAANAVSVEDESNRRVSLQESESALRRVVVVEERIAAIRSSLERLAAQLDALISREVALMPQLNRPYI